MAQTAVTGKSEYARRQAETRFRDMINTYMCTGDPRIRNIIDQSVSYANRNLKKIISDSPETTATVWTDGSWNQKTNTGGVGIRISGPESIQSMTFGKTIRAAGSLETEAYALAIGLSALLDSDVFQTLNTALIRYDCATLPLCAANIDAYVKNGTPYTNLRSAFRRARKSGLNVIFEHTKGHARDADHNICDIVARHYAGIRISPEEYDIIKDYIDPDAPAKNRKERR